MKISSLPYCAVRFMDVDCMRKWFTFASDIGLEGVELMYGWPLDWYVLHQVKKLLSEYPLNVSMIVTHNNFCRFTPAEQQEECRILDGYMALAEEFGTNIVRVLAGTWNRIWKETSSRKAVDAVVTTASQCLRRAEEKNMMLVMENHPGMGVDRDILQAIFEKIDSPNFGWNFDMENAYRREGQTGFDFLNEASLLKRLRYVHSKDFIEMPYGWMPVALGGGGLDVKGMFKKIKDSGYQGWLSFEYGGEDWGEIKRSADYIRETWPSI